MRYKKIKLKKFFENGNLRESHEETDLKVVSFSWVKRIFDMFK